MSNFVYGMVNKEGTAYAITINDLLQFHAFVGINGLYDMKSKWYNDLKRALEKNGPYSQAAEKALADALFDSGLSIMKSTDNTSTGNNWQRIEYNPATEQVETKPCN
jgi:hypothetical protein